MALVSVPYFHKIIFLVDIPNQFDLGILSSFDEEFADMTIDQFPLLIAFGGAFFFILCLVLLLRSHRNNIKAQLKTLEQSHQQTLLALDAKMDNNDRAWRKDLHFMQQQIGEKLNDNQFKMTQSVTSNLLEQMKDIRQQLDHSFKNHANSLSSHIQALNQEVRNNLIELGQQVNKRLNDGFDKTTTTFGDIVKRLTIIDEAQKRMAELSNNVVSLQDILNDKRSRGAFGEVQLSALIQNALPAQHYALQYSLSNRKRVDCMLFLPEPTGNIAIDAKFPLESYQGLQGENIGPSDKKILQQQFKQDIQKHILDIADKYIIPNETADSALMFIPAEAVFAEIHANYPELVNLSHQKKVWLVSPSTLMAVLTTARAVLKDDATRKQVHIIQQHLQALSKDFQRFEKRMEKLNRHIDMAQQDATEVNTSAKKITQRFNKIESVELDEKELIAD